MPLFYAIFTLLLQETPVQKAAKIKFGGWEINRNLRRVLSGKTFFFFFFLVIEIVFIH